MLSAVIANSAGLAGRWPKAERMPKAVSKKIIGQTSHIFLFDHIGNACNHGRIKRRIAQMASTVKPMPANTCRRNPRHSIGTTSCGYFKYSTNKRFGRTSYSAIKPGVAASKNTNNTIQAITQK